MFTIDELKELYDILKYRTQRCNDPKCTICPGIARIEARAYTEWTNAAADLLIKESEND